MGDMLEKRIKKYLNDIIDHAFADMDVFERNGYKAYQLNIGVREKSSLSGRYTYEGHRIDVFNPSLGARHLSKCCLHELSHHIDYMQNGKSGHQKPFYEIYAKLIYASLDMGILSTQDFDDHWSSDQNKVRAIVSKYDPHPVAYDTGTFMVMRVYNGYTVRDFLKGENSGYHYNKVEQVWEKELESHDESYIMHEKTVLEEAGIVPLDKDKGAGMCPCYEIVTPGMYMRAIVYIVVKGDTWSCDSELKARGFFFSSRRNAMIMKVHADECKALIEDLRSDTVFNGCQFGVLDRND